MIRALLNKELRQHGFALGFLLLLPFAGLILISSHDTLRRAGGGGFEAVRILHYVFVPLACLVLGQLFIAMEFRQKTQLFLEGLPLPRWRMLAVKFGLGLGFILLTAICALAFTWWKARHTEAMTPRFATLLAVKSAAWVGFIYTLCFAHAFLGRYRVPFGVAMVCGFAYCNSLDLPITEFGPFALVDSRFAFERFVWPLNALIITGGLILLLTVLGFFLGLVRDATVAALLAEKMSSREKLFVTFLSLVFCMLAGEISEHRKTSTPVQMPGAAEARRGVVCVFASAAVDAPTHEETAALQRVADGIAGQLAPVTEFLQCRSFPPVFVVHRRDLPGNEMQDGGLEASQGVLVRVNLLGKGFTPQDVARWLISRALLAQSHQLVDRERNAWVFDGFQWWWGESDQAQHSAWNPAVHAVRSDPGTGAFTKDRMHTWLTVRKELGREQAQVLAGSALALLAERQGIPALRRFLADRLGPAQPVDARAWLGDMLRPNSARLRAATGLSEEALAAEWRQAIAAAP